MEKALDFFYPLFDDECFVQFYGGEPLLGFPQIRKAVEFIQRKNRRQRKNVTFTISTNGSLIDDSILDFFDQNNFYVQLSFDGMAQNITKKNGSFDQIVSNIKRLVEAPNIDLETNSVFTPETLVYLTDSVSFLIDCGVPRISVACSRMIPWLDSSLAHLKNELSSLREFLLSHHERTEKFPVVDFQKEEKKGIYVCFAGKNQMTLAADGLLWGCYMFADYFRANKNRKEFDEFCFGDLDAFIHDYENIYPQVLSNYSKLRVDRFFTPDESCRDCSYLKMCEVCPVDNLFSGSDDIREVNRASCRMKRIFMSEKRLFRQGLESL
jgi:radical SAM protein with 4Fe4S-binding SPASM domain